MSVVSVAYILSHNSLSQSIHMSLKRAPGEEMFLQIMPANLVCMQASWKPGIFQGRRGGLCFSHLCLCAVNLGTKVGELTLGCCPGSPEQRGIASTPNCALCMYRYRGQTPGSLACHSLKVPLFFSSEIVT